MPDEQAFLRAILERPDDDAPRLIYADWLEERGDPRGEFLRWVVQVRQLRVVSPEQRRRHDELSAALAGLRRQERRELDHAIAGRTRPPPVNPERRRRIQDLEGRLAELSKEIRPQVPARLRELAAAFDPNWLAVVSDPEIEGCGKSGSLRFDFVCDKTWADLRPTGHDAVRHCEACRQNVHFCDNIADAREHSQAGHCIAVDLGVIRRDGDLGPGMMFLGMIRNIDRLQDRLRQTYGEDVGSVSQARLDARKQAGKNVPGGRRR
jgi:uncharacterized protein (TIGR02996 family)